MFQKSDGFGIHDRACISSSGALPSSIAVLSYPDVSLELMPRP